MKKVNKQLLSLMLGVAFISNALPVTTVFAAEESVLTSETLQGFADIYGTNVHGLELFYGPDYGTSVPVFNGLTDVDFTTLPSYSPGLADDTKTTFQVEGYLADNPYDGVAFAAEEVWAKDWVPIDMIDAETKPGHYKAKYSFFDSSGNPVGEESVVISFIDNISPVIDYLKDGDGNPIVATVILGAMASNEDVSSQWGLTVTDNRLGILDENMLFDLSAITGPLGEYNSLGLHSIEIPYDGWITDYQVKNPVDASNSAKTNLWINVVNGNIPPILTGNDIVLKVNEDAYSNYELLHSLVATDSEDGDISGNIQIQPDYQTVLNLGPGMIPLTPGIYDIGFTVTDSNGGTTSKILKVSVISDVQVTALETTVKVEGNYSFSMNNPVATDDFGVKQNPYVVYSEMSEGPVKVNPGDYPVIFAYDDINGNTITAETIVHVTNENPTITASDVFLVVGDTYDPAAHNAVVSDMEEIGLSYTTESALEPGAVMEYPGSYPVKFKVADSYGGTAETTVFVHVLGTSTLDPFLQLKEITLYEGDSYNSKDHVIKAESHDGISLTDDVYVSDSDIPDGILLPSHIGTHHIEMTVQDSEGRTTTSTTILYVLSKDVPKQYQIDVLPIEIWEGEDYFYEMHEPFGYELNTFEEMTVGVVTNSTSPVEGNTNKPGTYSVVFQIDDNTGKPYTAMTTLTVKPLPTVTAKDIVVYVGDRFNLLGFDVKAYDYDGSELSGYLINVTAPINGTGDYTTPGVYTANFMTENADKKTGTTSVKVTVLERPLIIDYFLEAYPVVISEGDDYSYDLHEPFGYNLTENVETMVTTVFDINSPQPGKENKPGVYPVIFKIRDENDVEVKRVETTLTVLAYPIVEGKNITVYVGQDFDINAFEIKAHDFEDGTLEFSFIPDNIPIGSDGKYTTPGKYFLEVQADDSDGMGNGITLEVTVLAKPTVGEPPVAPKPNPEPVKDLPPVIEGKDITLNVGDFWSLSKHAITTSDKEDGVTPYSVVKNNLPLSAGNQLLGGGNFEITISTMDSAGQTVTKILKVKVEGAASTDTGYEDNTGVEGANGGQNSGTTVETINQYGSLMDINLLAGLSVLLTLAGTVLLMENKNRRK